MIHPSSSSSSQRSLLPKNNAYADMSNGAFFRDPSTISTKDIAFPQLLEDNGQVEEQTLMQVEIVNEELTRKSNRSQLASKNACLTRRWQTALVTGLILLALAGATGGLVYWITSPRVVTQSFLLYGESCYMNSRSCDATRMLWCPASTCVCIGDFQWNTTIQNCSCGQYQYWTGVKCQGYGYFGDPCNPVPCRPTLTCTRVINQTYTTGQNICACDNVTYLQTAVGPSYGTCVSRLTYNSICTTNSDCQNWLGLSCTTVSSSQQCRCNSGSYWNGSICANNALGWQYCSVSVPCDTLRGLSCVSNLCQCDQYSYWDNDTTITCQTKKTYAASCLYDFQCNTTVNLSCPTNSTGCSCYVTSSAYICDCQSGTFWDGQRCTPQHSFNGTCPGQYACSKTGNLVCFLGHCICPGNMIWYGSPTNLCNCTTNTTWNTISKRCV